jgi:predicted Fe-Mo cluster-binding NifX family protein
MKIAITSQKNSLDSEIDLRFGRASGFIIYDLEFGSFEFVDNEQNLEAAQGAGIQAAQNILEQKVGALITGHCGPKAFRVLSSAGVKVYTDASGSINEVIEKYKNGELKEALSADVEGHW